MGKIWDVNDFLWENLKHPYNTLGVIPELDFVSLRAGLQNLHPESILNPSSVLSSGFRMKIFLFSKAE